MNKEEAVKQLEKLKQEAVEAFKAAQKLAGDNGLDFHFAIGTGGWGEFRKNVVYTVDQSGETWFESTFGCDGTSHLIDPNLDNDGDPRYEPPPFGT